MAEPFPDRILWAVEQLKISPSDRLLEIGCGNGAAVSLIGPMLKEGGTITAIDQSDKAIAQARKRNAELESAGKARFQTASLLEADLGTSTFDRIFAINVNLFWTNGERELPLLKRLLLPGGALYVFNQPPTPDKLPQISERTQHHLQKAGFRIRQTLICDQRPVPVLCVIAD